MSFGNAGQVERKEDGFRVKSVLPSAVAVSHIIFCCFTSRDTVALSLFCSQVIRENQIVVVVGETGSGKTTQMTQVRERCSASRV